MDNSKSQNGPEGAENSQNNNQSGIVSPSNDSFQQSLYIAALGLTLGLTGVVSPVTDDRAGIHYEFDFYHSESGTLIKVLQTLDQAEWKKYSDHPSVPLIIIDGHSAGFEVKRCSCCEGMLLDADHPLASAIHEYADSFVYYEEFLWEPVDHPVLGKMWTIVKPQIIRDMLNEDDESTEDGD